MQGNRGKHLCMLMTCAAIFISSEVETACADSFYNLGFEDAVIGTPVDFRLPASDALPDWNCYGSPNVFYDTLAISSAYVSIHDSLSPIIKPLMGRYSIILQDGCGGTLPLTGASAWISQTGDIPEDAKSLKFRSDITTYINELQVSIDGTVIPFMLYSTGNVVNPQCGPVNTYICDVSAFAGEAGATLKFEKLVHDPAEPWFGSNVDLDGIAFSTTPAPEPSSLVILGVGLLSLSGFSYYRCRRHREAS
jgi:hypothetical protein